MKKPCSKCGEVKDLEAFEKRYDTKSGYRRQCKLCRSTIGKVWYYNNQARRSTTNKIWRDTNKDAINIVSKKWRENNKDVTRARKARYRASKLNASPSWADIKAIKLFYKNCPEGYHVDHIIPLQGRNVRGLHVLCNLQYLTASENQSKGNRHESDR